MDRYTARMPYVVVLYSKFAQIYQLAEDHPWCSSIDRYIFKKLQCTHGLIVRFLQSADYEDSPHATQEH